MNEELQLSETDRAMLKLIPWANKFQERLRSAIEGKEDGMHRLTFHVKAGQIHRVEVFCGETNDSKP